MMSSESDRKSADNSVNFCVSDSDEKYKIVNELITMCMNNIEHYTTDKSFAGTRLCFNFEKLKDYLDKSVPVIKEIEEFAPYYDYDENTPGNGYRSFVFIFECALKYSMKTCQYITENRASLLFRKNLYLKELDVCTQMIESLYQICADLIKMHENSDQGNLYSKEYSHDNLITRSAKVTNQTCFYGRSVGFQFVDSMKSILKFLSVTLACFSEAYFSNGFKFMRTTNYFLKHPSYFMDPEMCARRIINVSHNADVKFCKSFWMLGENKLMHALPRLVGYQVDVNRVFKIPPEPLEIFSKKLNKMISIPIPHSHIGRQPVSCRLLCATRRRGMVGERSAQNLAEPSKHLIIHTHGGGWLATSSKSHEFYLREWASRLDIPIISIDYALCPKAPFPRGLEDVFYTYCWILKNCELLGTTAENVVFCGDSAGANLNTSCIIKCIEMGVPLPKGIFNAYSPFLVNFASTPARFLTLVDPLVPYGFIMRIFKCYGASKPFDNTESVDDIDESLKDESFTDVKDEKEFSALMSPDSSKCLEIVWQKVKHSTETPDWHSNLNSIEENSTEDPISPLIYRSDSIFEPNVVDETDDDDGDCLEMKISQRKDERDCDQKEDEVVKDEHKEYVENFVKKYESNDFNKDNDSVNINDKPNALKVRLNSRTFSEDNIVVDVSKESMSPQGLLNSAVSGIKSMIDGATNEEEHNDNNNNNNEKHADTLKRNYAFTEKKQTNEIPKAAEDEFVFSVPRNYLMSPFLASDDILKQFPKINILTTIVDPCLDDCIEFSKKLKKLNVDVELDIVGALNHGFLNFSNVSKECHDASMLCLKRIVKLLDMDKDIE
ncbi:unnamed protein product [Chironomus riparius]|uniref:Hormone-sensitive lipase n=1 Tax=Chironomus riparius TaxID=315576 RepID=A0A9N9WN75_9DIPT|nr:unnamed protein product [Chironomus riparius]